MKQTSTIRTLSATLLACLLLSAAAGCGTPSADIPTDTDRTADAPFTQADPAGTEPTEKDSPLTLPDPVTRQVTEPETFEPQTLPADGTDTQSADGHTWTLQSLVTSKSEKTPCAGVFLCRDCGASETRTVTPETLGAPMVKLSGTLGENVVDLAYDDGKVSFSCQARLSVQGATSSGFPKKNWTIHLQDAQGEKVKVKLADGWGRRSKYCLKANYVDFTQARNVVTGRLYGDIAASRGRSDDLSRAPNYGAVDGFAVAVFLNDRFYGLYTMNIPKDDWMFAMNGGADTHQAILMGADWTDHVALRKTTSSFKHGWELEYCSTEDTSWVMPSFNEMIDFVNSTDGVRFKRGIGQYLDVERAIDTLLYTTLFHGNDNVSKNILWVTYDGKVWIPSVYDMDDSWGMVWNGKEYYSATDFPFAEVAGRNAVWEKLWKYYRSEITARWKELRADVLSAEHIKSEFKAFFNSVPEALYDADAECWPDIPSRKTGTYKQISEYVSKRLKYLDSLM